MFHLQRETSATNQVKVDDVPEWLAALTIGEILSWIVGIAAIGSAIVFVWRPLKALFKFLEDWNGKPVRKDRAGNVIASGKPGVPALLETLRAQVENSHSTNLRDDIDGLRDDVQGVADNLHDHIVISKVYDRKQEATSRKLDQHVHETKDWHEMLDELHDRWVLNRQRQPPDKTE